MSDSIRYIICYDIADSPRRNRVARCLDDYGGRVQYSVFEAILDHTLLGNLVMELRALVDPARDRLLIYPICSACRRRAIFMGMADVETRPGEEITFIV